MTINEAVAVFPATFAETGTVAAALSLANVTVSPLAGAAALNVIVALEFEPPPTLVGDRARFAMDCP